MQGRGILEKRKAVGSATYEGVKCQMDQREILKGSEVQSGVKQVAFCHQRFG